MKTLIISLTAGLIVLLVAVLVVPSLVDWQAHRQWVEARLSAILGEPVRIAGEVDFAMLPVPSLTASAVTVGAVAGPEERAALEVRALDMRVSLLPLLTGRLDIERIVLVEPTFRVHALSDGSFAWVGRPLFDDADGGRGPSLGRLTIDNGRVDYRDEATGDERSLDDVFVQVTAESVRGPATLIGSVSLDGIAYTLDVAAGRVTGTGALPLTIGLGVDGLNGDVRFSGLLLPDGELHGDLSASGRDAVAAVHRFAPELAGLPDTVQRFTLRAPARLSTQSIVLDPLTVELGEARGTGKVMAAIGPEPSITAELAFNRLELDAWTGGLTLADTLDRLRTGDDFTLPLGFDLAVALSSDAIDYRGGLVRQIRLTGSLLDGTLSVDRFSASLPGGSDVAAVATIRAQDGLPWMDMAMEASSGDLRGLLEWLGVDLASIPPARLRSFAGGMSYTGTPRDFQASVVDLTIDGSRIDGGVAYRETSRHGLGLRLVVDRLDLDTYHLEGAQGFLPDLAGDAAARQAVLDLIASYDANIQIDAGQLTVRGATLEDLSVDATVAGGTVVLRRAQFASLASTAASLEGRIGALDPVAGVDLRVSVDSGDPDGFLSTLGIETPALLAPLAAAQATARLQGDAAVLVVDLEGTFPGGTLAVGGSVEQAFDAPAYDIAARVGHDDGQALVQLYAPSFAPRGPVGPVDLYARIVGTDQAFDLADLQGTVGDVPIAGTVAIDRTGERPRVDADLRTGAIAVDRFLPPPRVAALSSGFVGRWGTLAVDVQSLAAVDGSLSLAATTLGIGDLVVADPALRATLEAGTLTVPALTGHVLGGNFGLQATLAVEDPAQVAFEIDLVGADLSSGLRSLLDLDGLAGTFDFGIDATAHGSTIGAMIGSLSGEGLLAVRNGAILGVDLAQIDSGLTEASEPLDFLDRLREALREGETPFAAINVPFEVASGIALTEQLRAAGEIGFAEGRGMLDLAGERLDVSTEFYLYRHPEAPPFVIQLMGPLSNPVQRPQTQALQAYFAHKAAEALAERFATTPIPEPEPVEPRPNVAPPPPPGGPR